MTVFGIENIEKMYSVANVPVLAKPNAGLPQIDKDGRTFYPTSPEEFAVEGRKLIEAGARVLGGCCGTTERKKARKEKGANRNRHRVEKGRLVVRRIMARSGTGLPRPRMR